MLARGGPGVDRVSGLLPRPIEAISATLRQRRALAETAHRPWPLAERPWFMGQTWSRLLFAHWPVDPDALVPVLPPQLPLDTYEGKAWIGITPFRLSSRRTSSDGPSAELECAYVPTGEPFEASPGSLEHWLTERYCLYTVAEGGTVQRAEIHHPAWPLQRSSASIDSNTMTSGYGLALASEPLLHYSERQDVVLWTIEALAE